MDRAVANRVIHKVALKYNLKVEDILNQKYSRRQPKLVIAKDEICYILRYNCGYNLKDIAYAFYSDSHSSIILSINRYILRNKLKLIPKVKHKEALGRYVEMLKISYSIDPKDGFSILEAVYQLGYQAGRQKTRYEEHLRKKSIGGYITLPPNENNAPVAISEGYRGILNEGDHEQITASDRPERPHSAGNDPL